MENSEQFRKYTQEDVEFFDDLASRYGLEQDEEFLIIKRGDKEVHIPKWYKIPTENGGSLDIEELIQKRLEEIQDQEQ